MEQRQREKAQMDTDMEMDCRDADAGLSLPLHKALRVAIIAGASFASLIIPLSCLLAFCPKARIKHIF
jgi:hypothetical protein